MHKTTIRVRHVAAAAFAAAGLAGFAARSDASLTIDLRLPNGGKCITASTGDKFIAEVWATVAGTSADLANSYGLSSVNGSIVSQGRLAINIAGKQGDVAQYKGGVKTTALNPFGKSGEQPGIERDLDGDGDIDLGAPNQNSAEGFFIARADPQEYFGSPANVGIPTADGKGVQWKIGRIQATIIGNADFADLIFIPRRNGAGQIAPEAGLWYDDQGGLSAKNALTGTLISGAPLMVALCPEPSAVTVVLASAAAGLLRRRRRT
jgi:hypothetical protein